MQELQKWFADSKIASFLRHFLAILIALAIADFAKLGVFDFSNYQVWIISALVASAPPFLRWLNPYDTLE